MLGVTGNYSTVCWVFVNGRGEFTMLMREGGAPPSKAGLLEKI